MYLRCAKNKNVKMTFFFLKKSTVFQIMSGSEDIGKVQWNKGDPVNRFIFENSLRLHPAQENLIEVNRSTV